MSVTFFQPPNRNIAENAEYSLGNKKINGKKIYYRFYTGTKRISTAVSGLFNNVDTLLFQNLSFQGLDNQQNPTGRTYFFPYTHTSKTGVILFLNEGNLQAQAQDSGFSGNYLIKGFVVYTKINE